MSLLPMLSHITNTTRFEICHVMKIQLWIGKSLDRDGRWTEQWTVKCINQSSNSIQTLTYNNCILHSHLSSRWSHSTWNVLWEPKLPYLAEYERDRLYKPFNFFVITLCDNLQTLAIMTPGSEERTEKELHVQDTVFQKILYLCLRLI